MRPDVYTTSHKGIRRALTNLQFMAGRTDYTNDAAVTALLTEMRSLWDLLDFHAAGEDELVHPHLEKQNSKVYESLESEHDELVKAEKAVLKVLEELVSMPAEERVAKSIEFARELNGYIARYLMHTQREELEAMPVLWEALEDDQIMQIIADFPKKASPEIMAYFLHYMLPSVNPTERHVMVKGMKMGLPEAAFTNVLAIAKTVLSELEYSILEEIIS